MTAIPHAVIKVRVQPGAKKPGMVRYEAGVLSLKVSAPPLNGRANEAVMEAVAEILEVREARVSLIKGERSREKTLRVEGLSQEEADARLKLVLRP